MKRIFNIVYILILFGYSLFGANKYVDKDATGSNNGTSWTNAWTSISSINNASLTSGDTVFVSDGTYAGNLAPVGTMHGTASNYIVIISASYAYRSVGMTGHKGAVILTGGIDIQESGSSAPSYIKIKGFEVTGDAIWFDVDYPAISHGLYFESIYLHDYGSQFGFRVISNQDSLIVDSCIVIDCLDGAGSCSGQRDCMHFNYSGSTHPKNSIIRNCWMEMRSQDPTAHNDVIQSAHADGFTIYNNIFISDSVNSPEGGGMPLILSSNDDDQNDYPPVILFNNFCYMGGLWYPNASDGRVLMTRHDGGGTSSQQSPTYIFNNTLVNSGPRDQVVDQEYHIDFFSNNINASFCLSAYRSSPNGWYNSLDATDAYSGHIYRDSTRHNLFWREDNNQGFFGGSFYTTGGSTFSPSSWSTWISGGGTGVNSDPLFVDHFGHEPNASALTGKITSNSPAIGAGEDLTYLANYLAITYNLPNDIKQAMLKDREGRNRGSVWDIGAYEYADPGWSPPDTIPYFHFSNISNAELNTTYTATSVFSLADSTFHFNAGGGQFHIGALKSYRTSQDTAHAGDTVWVKLTTPGTYSTPSYLTTTGGGFEEVWIVTTKAEPSQEREKKIIGSDGHLFITSDGEKLIAK